MLTDANGQAYFPFVDPLGLPESTPVGHSQFTGISDDVSGLACKADSHSLHKNISDQAITLPDRPIIVHTFNFLTDTTVKASMGVNAFALGLYGVASLICFRRVDGQTREIRVKRNRIVVYGFDGARVRRFPTFTSIGEGINTLVRSGFRRVVE